MARSRVYVVQVVGGTERRVRDAIFREAGEIVEDCFLPSCVIPRKVHGEWRQREGLLFPGYVFVRTSNPDVLLKALREVRGLSRLLGVGEGSYASLSDDEVAWLDAVTGSGTHAMGVSKAVKEGDRVVVTSGPLRGREASIAKVDRHKRLAWVEVRMLGRRTTVKVGLEVVRARR